MDPPNSRRTDSKANRLTNDRCQRVCLTDGCYQVPTPATGPGRELPASARPPMTADEKTIATSSKKPQPPVDDRFRDFGLIE